MDSRRCTCGAASVPGLEGLHAHHCGARRNLGQRFRELYYFGVDGTFPIVEALAPKLVENRGSDRTPVINIQRFWEIFGPAVEVSDNSGLDWCFNQREGDHGHLEVLTLGSQDYWSEVV